MAGPGLALQDLGERPGADHHLRLTARVDLVDTGCEHDVDALALSHTARSASSVRGYRSRSSPGPNCRLTKIRDDHGPVADAVTCDPREAGVPVVERAHGGRTRPVPTGPRAGRASSPRVRASRVVEVMGDRCAAGPALGLVDDAPDGGRPDRQDPAVGDDPVEGVAREGDVRRQRVGRVGPDVGEVGPHGVGRRRGRSDR